MSARAEDKIAGFVAEGIAVFVSSKGVGRRFLLGERDIVMNTEFFFVRLQVVRYMLLEEVFMLVGDGEMQVDFLFLVLGIERAFDKMFESGSARTFLILMEEQKSFGELAVVHIIQEKRDYASAVSLGDTSLIHERLQFFIESKILEMSEKILNERSLFAAVHILKQVLEHTGGCTGSRHELEDSMVFLQILLPCREILLLFSRSEAQDAIADRGSRLNG